MYIFIDESGSFASHKESDTKETNFDCFAAVAMSDKFYEKWGGEYQNLEKAYKVDQKITEEVIKLLSINNAKIFISATDLLYHPEATVKSHKEFYMQNFSKFYTQEQNHFNHLFALSVPLYLKTLLIANIIENTIIWIYKSENHNCEKLYFYLDDIAEKIQIKILDIVKIILNRRLKGLTINYDIHFSSDDNFCGIKASDCIANFFRGGVRRSEKRNFSSECLGNFEKLLTNNYSIDWLHFDKDKDYIENNIIRENGKNFYNKINLEPYMVKTL